MQILILSWVHYDALMVLQALSCLEVTTQRLDKTLNGQRELEKHVQDLKQQISLSEKERAAWEEKCTMLLKECKLQMAKQEHDRDKITEMESKLANYRYATAQNQHCVHA